MTVSGNEEARTVARVRAARPDAPGPAPARGNLGSLADKGADGPS